jgi:hypothetical protein
MREVPRTERALLALDDQQRIAREHEEVFLVVLAVIHPHRLARPEDRDVDPELREIERVLETVALEFAEDATALAVPPPRLARVQHEPPLSHGD